MRQTELDKIVEALRSNSQPQVEPIVPRNVASVLAMGIICAAGALVWTTTTKTPESFAVVQQQTTEIRTTVLEMRSMVGGLSAKIDQNQKQTADQQAALKGLESTVTTTREAFSTLNERVTELERNNARK